MNSGQRNHFGNEKKPARFEGPAQYSSRLSTMRLNIAAIAKAGIPQEVTLSNFETFRAHPWRTHALILAALFLVYRPAIVSHYAFIDSYDLLASGMQRQMHGILEMIVQGGRPLYAVYAREAYERADGIGDLSYLRAFGVAGIGVLACVFYRALAKTLLPHLVAVAGALLICLTPSFQVYGAWDACSPFPWAAVLAGLAFQLCDKGGPARMAGSALLLACSIMIYQPAAMAFWDFAAIAWLLRPALPAPRRVLAAGGVMGAALICDFAVVKLIPGLLFGHGPAFARTALAHDLHGKFVWFLREPMSDAINVFSLKPSLGHTVLFGALMLIGFCLYFGRRAPVRLFLAACLIPATYVPNLMVAENWASYRTQDALAGLFVLFAVIAALGWVGLLRLKRGVPLLCVVSVAGAAWLATSNINTEFVRPQTMEYRMVQAALLHMAFTPLVHPCFNLAVWSESLAPISRYDEFGALSSAEPWVPAPMAYLILQTHSPSSAALFTQADNVPVSVMPGCTVVNLRALFAKVPRTAKTAKSLDAGY